jgi:replicative superfamily II helicase
MIDFKKHVSQPKAGRPTNPLDIYESLDRASDKGPLRPAQSAVLAEWYEERRQLRDVILKLHTGQGKTLVGLLMAQSQLNNGKERALYLCPDNMLVEQTCDQAQQFGIRVVTAEKYLPDEFLDSKAILVTTAEKLFNGRTKFELRPRSIDVSTIIVDDSHACIDKIRKQFVIDLPNNHKAYAALLDLFASDLEQQGVGTFAEIRQGAYEVFLPVPYWAWHTRIKKATAILAAHNEDDRVKFAWPLIKDSLEHCQCIASGTQLQIVPYRAPLDAFGTYADANHRVFMSATVTDDSFLVKGLGLSEDTIMRPLVYKDEKWSGEKMILLPSLIDDSLDRDAIIRSFAPQRDPKKSRSGMAALTPRFKTAEDWEKAGALVAKKDGIAAIVDSLRTGQMRHKTVAFANRYDGMDLPDDACRVLILDGRPRPESLQDRYDEMCRQNSEAIAMKIARVIEQGLGRSVRGERDYSVIILTGGDLVRHLRGKESREYFSDQTRTQIEIGLDAAQYAKEEVEKQKKKPIDALIEVATQCLGRDEGWKAFYVDRMNQMQRKNVAPKMLKIFAEEDRAERLAQGGAIDDAVKVLQDLLDDKVVTSNEDRGWYLQEMARYRWQDSVDKSNTLQIAAHKANRKLLKPRDGLIVAKITTVSQKRMQRIIEWVSKFETYDDLNVAVQAILDNMQFGIEADLFEQALDDLGTALGFVPQRPDKDWGEGPDNLWAVRDAEYILWECKNEVLTGRETINKSEAGQINTASAWCAKHYPAVTFKRIMIIPTNKLGKGAAFGEAVEIMRSGDLKSLVVAARAFFKEFRTLDLRSLSEADVQKFVNHHKLTEDDLLGDRYSKKPTAS